jgi:phosphoglycolate phosphatase
MELYPFAFDPSKIRLLAFDIDGTLFSSEDIILSTYILAFEKFNEHTGKNIPIPSRDAIMNEVGKPVKTIFLNLVPQIPEKERDEISDSVLVLLCDKIRNGEGLIYPKTLESLEYLLSKNLKLVSASNGRKPYVSAILEKIGIIDKFDDILVLDNIKIKTKVDIISEYKKKYSMSGNEILMIGDRYSDYQAAYENGCPFLFCAYGHANSDEINSFSKKIDSISEITLLF